MPSRANSASLMGSVLASSRLPGAASAGAAIETPYTAGEGGEGRREGGQWACVRAECAATLFECTTVSASGAGICSCVSPVMKELPVKWTLTVCAHHQQPVTPLFRNSAARLSVFMFLAVHTGSAEHFTLSEFSRSLIPVAHISRVFACRFYIWQLLQVVLSESSLERL